MENKMNTAEYWINKLDLIRHPEGGYYKQTYKADELIPLDALPHRFTFDHSYSTCIYYLLNKTDFSAFHRISQDELWHFYYGSPITIHIIDPADNYYYSEKVGINPEKDEFPQSIVKAGYWFAAEVNDKNSFSLLGCTVSPGFEFEDFELADRKKLIKIYPQHKNLISKFTR